MSKTEIAVMKHLRGNDKLETRNKWTKLVLALSVVGIGLLAAWRLGAFEFVTMGNIDRLRVWFDGLGPWAPVAFVVVWIVAAVLFIPGLVLTITGGLIFGAVWGTVWTTVGANLGAIAAFLIGRYAARDMVASMVEKNPTLEKIDGGVREHGWRMILITRLVPIFPFNVQNYVYGLTDIPLRTFVLVTLPAMLPATIAFNFAAGSLRTGDLGRTLWYLGIAALFFVLLSFLPGWARRRFSNGGLDVVE